MDTTIRTLERAAVATGDADALVTARSRAGLCRTCSGTLEDTLGVCAPCRDAGELIGKAGGPATPAAWLAQGHRAPRLEQDAPPVALPPRWRRAC